MATIEPREHLYFMTMLRIYRWIKCTGDPVKINSKQNLPNLLTGSIEPSLGNANKSAAMATITGSICGASATIWEYFRIEKYNKGTLIPPRNSPLSYLAQSIRVPIKQQMLNEKNWTFLINYDFFIWELLQNFLKFSKIIVSLKGNNITNYGSSKYNYS